MFVFTVFISAIQFKEIASSAVDGLWFLGENGVRTAVCGRYCTFLSCAPWRTCCQTPLQKLIWQIWFFTLLQIPWFASLITIIQSLYIIPFIRLLLLLWFTTVHILLCACSSVRVVCSSFGVSWRLVVDCVQANILAQGMTSGRSRWLVIVLLTVRNASYAQPRTTRNTSVTLLKGVYQSTSDFSWFTDAACHKLWISQSDIRPYHAIGPLLCSSLQFKSTQSDTLRYIVHAKNVHANSMLDLASRKCRPTNLETDFNSMKTRVEMLTCYVNYVNIIHVMSCIVLSIFVPLSRMHFSHISRQNVLVTKSHRFIGLSYWEGLLILRYIMYYIYYINI